jgi:hypothetical protein
MHEFHASRFEAADPFGQLDAVEVLQVVFKPSFPYFIGVLEVQLYVGGLVVMGEMIVDSYLMNLESTRLEQPRVAFKML